MLIEGQFEITEWPGQNALVVRTHTPAAQLPHVLGQTWGRMMGYLGSKGMQPTGAPFVAYYNLDMDDLEVEIGLPLAGPVASEGDMVSVTMPAGKVATAMHKGPYDTMRPTYDALAAWMGEQGVAPVGVAYEIYLSDPGDTAPEDLLTQVAFPLAG